MKIETRLVHHFKGQLLSTPKGRAHVLNQIADAEDNGEAAVFDELLKYENDPKLKTMIRRHRDDEIRHGELFRECVKRQGVEPPPLREDLKLLSVMQDELGAFFDKKLETDHDVMMAFLILQALEERALEQFAQDIPVFDEVDPESAQIFRQVAKDEERHLLYCQALSKRYAPDDQTRDRELKRVRRIEAQSFRIIRQRQLNYIRELGLLPPGLSTRLFAAVGTLTSRVAPLPFTPYGRGSYVPVPA